MIQENLETVKERIQNACRRAGRNPDEVTLIAVSKTKPVEMLQEAYEAGVREFGENKPQELRDKYPCLPQDIHWHMIGHLQRNKIKYLIDKVCLIHSVDSLRLAEAIDEEAGKRGLRVSVLAEVNMAGEESKFGVTPQEAPSFVEALSRFPHLRVEGLMTIAPFTEHPEENRPYLRNLKI